MLIFQLRLFKRRERKVQMKIEQTGAIILQARFLVKSFVAYRIILLRWK